jgi:tRNA A37 methylthiotransferase MiaB
MVEGQSKLVSRQATSGSVELGWEKRSGAITQMVGRTRGDQIVVFEGSLSQKGVILEVEIVAAQNLTLMGRSIEAMAP